MSADPYVINIDQTVKNGDTLTIPYTFTITTTGTTNYPVMGNIRTSTSTATSGGTWAGTVWSEPDMTDWPASDIIDYFARQLAERHPA
jgi:hypothetical protein